MLEADLRKIIRTAWPKLGPWAEPHWVEWAPGGTPGHADVNLPIKPGLVVATELKIGSAPQAGDVDDRVILGRKFRVHLRPSQVRFHSGMEDVGGLSAVIAWIGGTNIMAIYPHGHIERPGVRILWRRTAGNLQRVNAAKIVEVFNSKLFWKGSDCSFVETDYGMEHV